MQHELNSFLPESVCFFISGVIGVAAVSLTASDVKFNSKDENWNPSNVNDAMNDLYELEKECNGNMELVDTYFKSMDTTNGVNTYNYSYTVEKDGLYMVDFSGAYLASKSSTYYIKVNGVKVNYANSKVSSGSYYYCKSVTLKAINLDLKAGDVITASINNAEAIDVAVYASF